MLVAGLMSGTSADGIDVALVNVSGLGWRTRFQLLSFQHLAYPAAFRSKILSLASSHAVSAGEISQLNFALGEIFANACKIACRRARIPLQRLELIGSHGQTIFHQNQARNCCGFPVRSTLQIGEPAVIAERTGVTTVADFRPADIAAGGQGAPLVPFFDYLLFRHPKRGRVALNVGGIANLTAIPAQGKADQVVAFDTGPGNMILDALASLASGGQQSYDAGGGLAAGGQVRSEVLTKLLRLPYFHVPPPKTAGREQFGAEYVQRWFLKKFGRSRAGLRDALATATEFTAQSIAQALADHVLPRFPVQECFASGGGVKNRFLMSRLQTLLARQGISLHFSEEVGVPAGAKEAMAFALLAYHTIRGRPSNLPSATGARHPAILGKVVYARP